jgi:response regulator RpfG family c-di-GMP phosphodiesterase
MTSDRPYRDGLGFRESVDEIRRHAGTQFDPKVVDAFVANIDRIEAIYRELAPSSRRRSQGPRPAPSPV